MTAKVLPFRRDQAPADDHPAEAPEHTAADTLLARHGAFVALLIVRLVLVAVRPAARAWLRDPAERRRVVTRLEAAERSVRRVVGMLVRGALR
jgi:hypothetical protein